MATAGAWQPWTQVPPERLPKVKRKTPFFCFSLHLQFLSICDKYSLKYQDEKKIQHTFLHKVWMDFKRRFNTITSYISNKVKAH